MKKFVSLVLCTILILTCNVFPVGAVNEEKSVPYVVDFSLASFVNETEKTTVENRASGLILYTKLSLSVSGTNLKIVAETRAIADVVKCGFKDLVVQRRTVTSSTWSDYYDFGDVYVESNAASLNTNLAVPSGYQYRLSCKHYAKKSLFVTENISNTSNVVGV